MGTQVIKRADYSEIPAVLSIINERIEWLRHEGSTQWGGRDFTEVVTEGVHNGRTWLLLDDDRPVATITLTTCGDKDFWTTEELKKPFLYVSKMASKVDRKGSGLGWILLNWALSYAYQHHMHGLRWDAWRTNNALHRYYSARGVKVVRTEELAHRNSGTLFEWAWYQAETSALPITVDPDSWSMPTGADSLKTLNFDEDNAGRHGLSTASVSLHELSELGLTLGCSAPASKALWHNGHDWMVKGQMFEGQDTFSINLPAGWQLHQGHPYALHHVNAPKSCYVALRGYRPSKA